MRFFIPTAIFHPDSGGPATYLYRFLPELLKRGHTVRVLTFGEGETEGYGYPLIRVSLKQGLLKRRMQYLRHYREELGNAEVVYINNLGLPRARDSRSRRLIKVVGDYAWERAINRGWIAPDTDIDTFQTRRDSPLVEWLKGNRAREVRTIPKIIVPSDYLRRMVIGWGAPPERVQVIYNALEREPLISTSSPTACRAQFGIDPHHQVMVTAARLTAWKGIDYLIQAVARLTDLPQLRLVIAGDGPQRAELEALVKTLGVTERVRFLGKVPHQQMGTLLTAADYFALYSGYEGLAHVLLESLTVGTPVIASDRGGNPEVVTDGVNGLLVKHPNLDALCEGVRHAFQPGVRAELQAHTKHGLDRFQWSRLVEETIRLLEAR